MHVAMHLCSSSVVKTFHGQALIKCAAIRFVSLRLPSLKGILGSHTVCISNLDLTEEVFFWILHHKGMLLIFKPCTKFSLFKEQFSFNFGGCLSVYLSKSSWLIRVAIPPSVCHSLIQWQLTIGLWQILLSQGNASHKICNQTFY